LKKISIVILLITLNCYSQNKVSFVDSILAVSNTHKELNISKILGRLGAKRYPEKSDKIIAILLQKATTSREKADCYYSLSNYYYYANKPDSALMAISKAEKIINTKESPLLSASIITTKSGILKKTGSVVKANRLMQDALQILENLDTTKLSKEAVFKTKGKKMVLYNSIAIFNMKLGNYEIANNYLQKAIAMAKEMNEKATAGILLNNQGDLLTRMGKYHEAFKVLKESEALKKESKLPQSFQLSTALNLATVYYFLNEKDKALHKFDSIIKPIEIAKKKSLLAETLLRRSRIYEDNKKYNQAIKDLKQAYDLAVQIKDLELQKQISNHLYQSFYAIKNYKKAVDYQNVYTLLKDSIFNDNNIKKLTQMEMQYRFDKKTALQKIKTEAAFQRNQQTIKMLYFGLIALFIIAGLGYRLYYIKKKNSHILEEKNKIINKQLKANEILLKETHHRVKNSLQMISSLLYLQSENIENKKAAASVKEGQMRVKSVALIHQKLYQKDCLTGIEISDYIKDLVESIFQSHQIHHKGIELKMELDKIMLDIDTVIPIGIIINELVVNAIKHAFDEHTKYPKLNISFKKKGKQLILKVIDNGKGFDIKSISENTFGMKLIKSLIRKLKATFDVSIHNGTTNTIIINEFLIKQ